MSLLDRILDRRKRLEHEHEVLQLELKNLELRKKLRKAKEEE